MFEMNKQITTSHKFVKPESGDLISLSAWLSSEHYNIH